MHANKRQIIFVRIRTYSISGKLISELDLIHESTGEKTKAKDNKIVLSRESPTIKPLTPVLCHKPIFYLYPWAIWHWAAPPCSPRCRSRTANGHSSTTRSCPSVGPWMASPRDAPWRGGGWRCRPWCRSRPWWRWRRGCRRGWGASSHLESRLWKFWKTIFLNPCFFNQRCMGLSFFWSMHSASSEISIRIFVHSTICSIFFIVLLLYIDEYQILYYWNISWVPQKPRSVLVRVWFISVSLSWVVMWSRCASVCSYRWNKVIYLMDFPHLFRCFF